MTNPSPVLREAPPRLAEIQAPVEEELAGVIDELRRIVVSDFHMIEEVNEYLLLMRGKLFRPTLLLLSNAVGSEPGREGVTLGAVVELVHLATLVHDDAVDHSVLRRGLPTVNALWTHQVAVIMGDYLYSRSVTELADLDEPRYISVLAQAANEMSVGEMRQLTSYDALDFSEEDYDRLIAAKTASLMAAACEMGAIAGGGRHRESLRSFGRSLGMAFQIADDLLDYTGTEAVTGKPTGHDLRERKVTLPLVGALRAASDAEVREIRRFFTLVDPDAEAIDRVVEIVRDRGGLAYARSRAEEYADRARGALAGLPAGPALDALRASVAYAVERSR
ncbi:MAG: octaprenyl-diphosphate synthase [Gemmatimonadetes bacterium]|nr:polyprenyl synthetase family protein [Gemmatimonadota bacterium]NIR79638.1 polyprenyl synthetase family protein [Gemmatimonadota bacterium]NIT88338.1 polyprenyl synthetase family protein [Gemmatimonadota bacterium]NIU32147.1 polyprenyl synthetase family protein [Gemmatimonadota bacterium]NIU36715.1 octaprenyl-diphosphate synthase [Gemmatimonadota bacterium]